MNIIVPSSPFRKNPIETSSLETEGLYGEKVEILETFAEWACCKLLTDNYLGWIKYKDLGKLKTPTHRVISNRTFILNKKDLKSHSLNYLPLGSQISVQEIDYNWATISMNKDLNIVAYIPKNHIININIKINNWVEIAENLVGTPYNWGGRNSMGLDCSALLQLSYQTYGQNIPRNTDKQINLKKKEITNLDNLDRGCVVFWKGHVGIMVDKVNCIHANAFHMKTVIEPINKIIDRFGKTLSIKKMMDFNM
jgi:hypothetical protein